MGARSRRSPMSHRVLCAVLGAVALAPPVLAADRFEVRFGVAAFGAVDPLRDVKTVAGCGYDYLEPALSKAVALSPKALAAARQDVQASGLRVETMNWFLPGSDIKLTGPTVDREQVRAYLEKSLALAESFGAKVIVFGSPAARTVPDGFPREKAWAQLVDFLRLAGQVIETRGYGMVIGIEALRKPETNIVNSVAEALRLAREVRHPRVKLIVDFYHLAFENEDPDVVLQAGDRVAHVQIADPAQRSFPKDDPAEPRYRRFFDNLRKIGYRGRISVEAESKDLAGDCGPALQFLKRLAAPPMSR
ncbi:MAG: sugar phosphate isomerase [Acidobacteria bacterium]|nr:MAG: sugar phosphate isomerase [Acidobacteriota bacterium]